MKVSDMALALSYCATTVVILAFYRKEVKELLTDIRVWYASKPRPFPTSSKLGADIEDAINNANREE